MFNRKLEIAGGPGAAGHAFWHLLFQIFLSIFARRASSARLSRLPVIGVMAGHLGFVAIKLLPSLPRQWPPPRSHLWCISGSGAGVSLSLSLSLSSMGLCALRRDAPRMPNSRTIAPGIGGGGRGQPLFVLVCGFCLCWASVGARWVPWVEL